VLITVALTLGLGGCAARSADGRLGRPTDRNEADPGEVKVQLDQTPVPVRRTIDRLLSDARLEDISKKTRDGKTVYETDLFVNGGKREVVVAEDGSIVSDLMEGSAQERAEDAKDPRAESADFRQTFDVRKGDLRPTGDNRFMPLKPGNSLVLKHGIDTLTISVLPEPQTVDGVPCAVLEERETKDGKLEEVSRNFFATDPKTRDVYYFGEDVDVYKDGKVINHESAWQSGKAGAKFGLQLPGKPKAGDRYYQELAPKVAMDRVEVISTHATVKTPAGEFKHCVHLKETTPLEADVSHKYYAPGLGLIKDDEFELGRRP
jgi:hypothetical protein